MTCPTHQTRLKSGTLQCIGRFQWKPTITEHRPTRPPQHWQGKRNNPASGCNATYTCARRLTGRGHPLPPPSHPLSSCPIIARKPSNFLNTRSHTPALFMPRFTSIKTSSSPRESAWPNLDTERGGGGGLACWSGRGLVAVEVAPGRS